MEIGKINRLVVARRSDYGLYLVDNADNEVLLPNAYVTEEMSIADELEVFLYKDSEDRLVATTLTPKVQLERFAYLQVKDTNQHGAFLDWGLPKDLMVPHMEQSSKMEEGNWYLIFLFLDEQTNRLVASSKINDFFFYEDVDVQEGDEVDLLIYKKTDLGYNVVVNNMFKGLIYHNQLFKSIQLGDSTKGYVKFIREDGKIDVVLEKQGYENTIDEHSKAVLDELNENDGYLSLNDKSSPEDIKFQLEMSKKNFKKAIGSLYKQKLIEFTEDGIKLT